MRTPNVKESILIDFNDLSTVDLPNGTKIIPNDIVDKIAKNNTVKVNINNINVCLEVIKEKGY